MTKKCKILISVLMIIVFSIMFIPTDVSATSTNVAANNILRGRNNKRIAIDGVYGIVDEVKNIKRYNNYSTEYAKQVVDVAKSYYLAQNTGAAKFQYNQNSTSGLFNGNVTDENGKCVLDCSGFIGLVLRGIDYTHSPFNGATGTANKSFTASKISILCKNSSYDWADDYLDLQTDSSFKNIGIKGKYSIRTAADIAQYYYQSGCTVYEFESDPTSLPTDLQPGDLVFWSKSNASSAQKSRFKAISHVGIVADDTTMFYHVTTTNITSGRTVFYGDLNKKLEYMTLIVRPNYTFIPNDTTSGIPLNTNLLPTYGYDDCENTTSITKNNLTFTQSENGGVKVSKGQATSGTTFYIYNRGNAITLTPGTYELDGAPVFPGIDTNSNSTKWGISLKDTNGNTLTDINGNRVWNRGSKCTFEITHDTEVYVYIYISADLNLTTDYLFKPSLVKIK